VGSSAVLVAVMQIGTVRAAMPLRFVPTPMGVRLRPAEALVAEARTAMSVDPLSSRVRSWPWLAMEGCANGVLLRPLSACETPALGCAGWTTESSRFSLSIAWLRRGLLTPTIGAEFVQSPITPIIGSDTDCGVSGSACLV
jgi:hypothetical protein